MKRIAILALFAAVNFPSAFGADAPEIVLQTLPPDAAAPLKTLVKNAVLGRPDPALARSPATAGQCFVVTPSASAQGPGILETGEGVLAQGSRGILFSVWVKAEAAVSQEARASLTLKSGGSKYRNLASVPLREDVWTRLAAWVEPDGASTLILQVPTQTPCLIDSPRAWVAPEGHANDPREPLRIEGKRLLEGAKPILLNGVNLSTYSDDEKEPVGRAMACSDEDDYRMIAEAGFNCVRLNLWHKAFASPAGWQWLDLHLAWAAAHGLRVMLDLHAPPGGYQGPEYKNKAFYKDESLQKAAIDFWKTAAARYRGCPTVAAFDLINEPCPRQDAQWWAWVGRAIPEIRASGWQGPVVVEKSFAKDSGFVKLEDPAVIYDAHFYDPWNFCSGKSGTYGAPLVDDWRAPGILDKAFLSGALREELIGFAEKHGVPANVGEYGITGSMIPHGADRWLRDVRALFDEHGIHRQYWCWHTYAFGLHDDQWHRTDPPNGQSALLEIAAKPRGSTP